MALRSDIFVQTEFSGSLRDDDIGFAISGQVANIEGCSQRRAANEGGGTTLELSVSEAGLDLEVLCQATGVEHDDIGSPITIHISDSHGISIAECAEGSALCKATGSVSDIHQDLARTLGRQRDIEKSVLIEIADRRLSGNLRVRVAFRLCEGAVPIAQEDGKTDILAIAHHQVIPAIAIEVSCCQRGTRVHRLERVPRVHRSCERAIAQAGIHDNVWSISNDEVCLSIRRRVDQSDRTDRVDGLDRAYQHEGAIGLAESDLHQRLGPGLADGNVHFAIPVYIRVNEKFSTVVGGLNSGGLIRAGCPRLSVGLSTFNRATVC